MNNSANKFIYLHEIKLKYELGALLFFLTLLAVLRYDVFNNISSHILGGVYGDGGLYWWLFNHNIENYFKLPFFNTLGFYPYSLTLAWSDNFILPAILSWPLDGLLSRVALYNGSLLIATFLNGYLSYLLAFRLSGYFLPSLISGSAIISYPFFTAHLGHPQLQFFFWIPLALIFFFGFLSNHKFTSALLCGLVAFLSFLTSVYYSIFLLILLKLLFFGIIIQKPKYLKLKDYLKLGAGFLTGFMLIVPFLAPYFAVKDTFGERFLYEATSFKASILSYLSAPEFNWLYSNSSIISHKEAQLFGGFIVLAFLIAAFFRSFGDRHFRNLSFAFVALAFAGSAFSALSISFSLPTALCLWLALFILIYQLHTLGKFELKLGFKIITNRGIIATALFAAFIFYFFTLGPLENFGIYTLYYYLFPGAEAIRAVGRAGVIVYFLIALSIPLTFHFLNKSGFLNNKILILLLIFIPLENWTKPYPLEEVFSDTPVFKYLQNQTAKNGALIVLPYSAEPDKKWGVKKWSEFASLNTEYLSRSLITGMPAINGYSGQRSRLMYTLPADLENFPDERSIQALSKISNLRHIIIDAKKFKNFNAEIFFKKVADFSGALTHVLSDSDFHLFEFHPFSKIENETEIWMPSYPAKGKASLQLYYDNCDLAELKVPVYLKKYFEETPYAELTLKKEIGWESKEIILPETQDKVAPAIIILKPHNNCSLYLKDRSYFQENAENH